MKISFALYDYDPFGGLQEDCLATVPAMSARRHQVHIFTRSWQGEPPAAIRTHILSKTRWTNLSRNDHFFRALKQALPHQRLDGVVAFNHIPDADI
jgi:UDP-glucose:(heptosyl)LPS alpha-1,3-glucosyltransferase